MFKNHPQNNAHCSNWMTKLLFSAALLISAAVVSQPVHAAFGEGQAEKEWTFLLFLNGHNNLDSFGAYNINQMEQVGSTDQLNMVVQWASEANGDTKRLLVQKDNDTQNVTSPAVETMPAVDMGDYKNLVEFVRWGVKNYPAKHYMIAVWNHGNGWHIMNKGFQTRDISYDDTTGHHITTEQLGVAMSEAAQIIGHKVDIYGSDACLMAMVEIAAEMKNSVQYFVGSEEVEPGYGWPYNTWMARWAANASASPAEVSTYLTEEYLKAYDGGIYGTQDVTYSAYDVSKIDGLLSAMNGLNASLANLTPSDMNATKTAANATMSFTLDDYKDLEDFTNRLASSKVSVNSSVLSTVKEAVSEFVIAGGGTGVYSDATGVAVWLPTYSYQLSPYKERYSKLEFNKATGWLSFLEKLAK